MSGGPWRTLVIAGPTASGKSALALAAAARWPVEIISVDSALVYRGMDIGTAKPTPAEQAIAPHHLIDVVEPTQACSAAWFCQQARALIPQIHARGRHALLVGGTMLYVKALRDGLDALPAADPAVRAALDARAAVEGWPALHAELARVDPVTAARLPPHDAQRIQRALEVWQLSGEPISAFHGRAGEGTLPGLDLPMVSLEPQERAWLHHRVAERFDQMLAAGFVDEVRALRARGDLDPGLPSMRCVGYRQAWELLDASRDGTLDAGAQALLRERGIAATRQLAKRQLTWLRGMDREVLRCDAPDLAGRAGPLLERHLGP
ncbi:MAG: tRNA dimethylallyltransferase MiaA [Pseudomonadota bacterium]|jgi:tRNA dimethylallyltransferase